MRRSSSEKERKQQDRKLKVDDELSLEGGGGGGCKDDDYYYYNYCEGDPYATSKAITVCACEETRTRLREPERHVYRREALCWLSALTKKNSWNNYFLFRLFCEC